MLLVALNICLSAFMPIHRAFLNNLSKGRSCSYPNINIFTKLTFIEKDDYGRILFLYRNSGGLNPYFRDGKYALGICQDMSGLLFGQNTVSYYDNFAYIGGKTLEEFTPDKIKQLKEWNDWNKPLDKTKCVSYQITDHKVVEENTYKLNEDQCNEILNDDNYDLIVELSKTSL